MHMGYAKRALAEIYHHSMLDNFPLDIWLRFVPNIALVPDSQDKVCLFRLIGLQKKFLDKIPVGTYSNGEFWHIDAILPDRQSIHNT
jgi:hypothetical protein